MADDGKLDEEDQIENGGFAMHWLPDVTSSVLGGFKLPLADSEANREPAQMLAAKAVRPSSHEPPRLLRAFSTPAATQLGHLQNPHRSGTLSPSSSPPSESSTTPKLSPDLIAFSLELTDSFQMAIQTLLQVSPPHLLDPAKEQFAACFLPLPVTTMTALFTLMKNLNYMAANMHSFLSESEELPAHHQPSEVFDVGELLQSVADAVGGLASNAGVELVLYHGDGGMKHINVKSDECGLSFALSHILRQIIAISQPGDSIEMGIRVSVLKMSDNSLQSSANLQFDISHRREHEIEKSSQDFPKACFKNLIFSRLLSRLRSRIESALPGSAWNECRYRLSALVGLGSDHELLRPINGEDASRQPFPHLRLAQELTVSELSVFADTLRGKKVAFHASSQGVFAHRLTSYLTTWGMDISHISIEVPNSKQESVDPVPQITTGPPVEAVFPPIPASDESLQNRLELPIKEPHLLQPTFIIIDDDVHVLREQILSLRSIASSQDADRSNKRPPLIHRPKSSPHLGPISAPTSSGTIINELSIIHFTGIANYRLVRDFIQTLSEPQAWPRSEIPHIIAVPKPVGPRRFLAALYTAVRRPWVDPLFAPIATSPASPLNLDLTAYRGLVSSYSPAERKPRSSTLLDPKNGRDTNPYPFREPTDNYLPYGHTMLAPEIELKDYFPESIRKLGSTPASGLLIQNPDGQPAGIFFQPSNQSKNLLFGSGRALRRGELDVKSKPIMTPENAKSSHINGRLQVTPTETKYPMADHISRPTHNVHASSPRKRLDQHQHRLSKSTGRHRPKPWDASVVPPINVLIVEDNSINRTILSTFMKKKKISYAVAENGLQAVEKFVTGNFHLILMDIQMPVMDGIQATQEIRRFEAERRPKYPNQNEKLSGKERDMSTVASPGSVIFGTSAIIVALTASSLHADRVNALAAGCNDFLTKPVSWTWLNNKITEWGSLKALQMWGGVLANPSLSLRNAGTVGHALESTLSHNVRPGGNNDSDGAMSRNGDILHLQQTPAGGLTEAPDVKTQS